MPVTPLPLDANGMPIIGVAPTNGRRVGRAMPYARRNSGRRAEQSFFREVAGEAPPLAEATPSYEPQPQPAELREVEPWDPPAPPRMRAPTIAMLNALGIDDDTALTLANAMRREYVRFARRTHAGERAVIMNEEVFSGMELYTRDGRRLTFDWGPEDEFGMHTPMMTTSEPEDPRFEERIRRGQALRRIAAMGRVCEDHDLCDHPACEDSHHAAQIAFEALHPEAT